jgi:hypothetical protein
MAGAACGASLAAAVASDPAIGLGIVLALTSLLALVLHGWKARSAQSSVDSSRPPHRCVAPPHPLSQDEVREIPRSYDATPASP